VTEKVEGTSARAPEKQNFPQLHFVQYRVEHKPVLPEFSKSLSVFPGFSNRLGGRKQGRPKR